MLRDILMWVVNNPNYTKTIIDAGKAIYDEINDQNQIAEKNRQPNVKKNTNLSRISAKSPNAKIINSVNNILASTLYISYDEIKPDSNLKDLGADSLDAVEIIMEIEKEFDITISDEVAENVSTVGDIYMAIAQLKK